MKDITGILKSYYRRPAVRSRISEFLGGDCAETATCEYITADGPFRADRAPRPPGDLDLGLDEGLDICRSLWDSACLIAHLDVEYVNFDFAGEPYLDPGRAFELQEPVARAIETLLAQFGIHPLHVLSGRGHHYAWSIPADSAAFECLVELGRSAAPSGTPNYLPRGRKASATMVRAFAGLGLVMEFVAHHVKKVASPECAIPVDLTAVEVGPTLRGREMVSIDVSEYGDPLPTRTVRTPFSGYLKPWQQEGLVGTHIVQQLEPLVFVPLKQNQWGPHVHRMRTPDAAAEIATDTPAGIPSQPDGMAKLVTAYRESSLRTFHEWFYAETPSAPESWPYTYDLLDRAGLPACAQRVLTHPNDLLLRPCNMRLITQIFLARGWHPRHIAGLIRSKFERDFGWGNQWTGYDPAMRAEFYTRIFSGLFAVGTDDLIDLNCQSAREKGICTTIACPDNLERFRQCALELRNDDKLARGPVNGLFLAR